MFIARPVTFSSCIFLTITNKTSFERVYRIEKNANVKERMLLVLNVVYHGKIAAHVAREIHKSKG